MANKFGVEVGDLFRACWGYEQTNNDFFQVVELVGTSSVRVKQVAPRLIASKAYPSGMAEDRTYENTKEMLPTTPFSIFIKDQEHGDVKRIKWTYHKEPKPCFRMADYADAVRIDEDVFTTYDSWYY